MTSPVSRIVTAFLMVTASYAQTTFYVDDDAAFDPGPGSTMSSDPLEDGSGAHPYDSIQEAIDAASPGDRVEVLDGLYEGVGNFDINFRGKPIQVVSANGATDCIVDAGGTANDHRRVFVFDSGETPQTFLAGFTVQNGYAGSGGGILCYGGSSPTIADCHVRNNTAVSYGGGMRLSGGAPVIRNCVFSDNLCLNDGGGVSCHSSRAIIANCLLTLNRAHSDGGGLHCRNGAQARVVNCLIVNNQAAIAGGVTCHSSSPTITNSAIVNNQATNRGGGMWLYFFSNPRVHNSILWGNTPEAILPNGSGDNPRVSFSIVEGGWSGVGNISQAPLFVDDDGGDNDPSTWHDNDFSLQASSPGVDAGANALAAVDLADMDDDGNTGEYAPFDLAGNPRFADDLAMTDSGCGFAPIVDIGPYESGTPGPVPCRGDLDGDRMISLEDLAIALADFGCAGPCEADADCNGAVDLTDLAVVLAEFGRSCTE